MQLTTSLSPSSFSVYPFFKRSSSDTHRQQSFTIYIIIRIEKRQPLNHHHSIVRLKDKQRNEMQHALMGSIQIHSSLCFSSYAHYHAMSQEILPPPYFLTYVSTLILWLTHYHAPSCVHRCYPKCYSSWTVQTKGICGESVKEKRLSLVAFHCTITVILLTQHDSLYHASQSIVHNAIDAFTQLSSPHTLSEHEGMKHHPNQPLMIKTTPFPFQKRRIAFRMSEHTNEPDRIELHIMKEWCRSGWYAPNSSLPSLAWGKSVVSTKLELMIVHSKQRSTVPTQ